jgi:undecaprenyl pyrophosphate phosphatase UppP
MTGELDIYGVFLPSLAAWMVIAFLASLIVRRLLTVFGFYNLVWHRPLFDFALYVVLLGTIVSFVQPLMS